MIHGTTFRFDGVTSRKKKGKLERATKRGDDEVVPVFYVGSTHFLVPGFDRDRSMKLTVTERA